jgi:hypothetical protein
MFECIERMPQEAIWYASERFQNMRVIVDPKFPRSLISDTALGIIEIAAVLSK